MNTPRQRFLQIFSLWTLMVWVLAPLLASSNWCPVPTAICASAVTHISTSDAALKTKPCCCKIVASRAMRACCNTQPKSQLPQFAVFTTRTDNRVFDSLSSMQDEAPLSLTARRGSFAQPAPRVLLSRTVAFLELQSLDHPPPSGRAPPVA